jgi:hypothetical protein
MKDLGPLHHFLGITVEQRPDRLFLHQRTYTLDILKRAVMADCKPCSTPVDLKAKLAADSGPPGRDPFQFRSIAGALQYLTFTRPDIAYAVQQVCLHMHDPRDSSDGHEAHPALPSGHARLRTSPTPLTLHRPRRLHRR